MRDRFSATLTMAAALLMAGTMMASTPSQTQPQSDSDLAQKMVHEVRMYPWYSLFDNVSVRAHDGDLELDGQVSQPYKKADLGRLAQRIPGVRSVTNDLQVLPTSFFDDRLRVQVARAIYRDPVLSRYALQVVPPIHIIVDNGHVTLEGVVNNQMEKNVAGIRAGQAGLSLGQVTNNLRVENKGAKS